jgi:tetratricopeptide (TPR) repeat protein
VILPGQAPPRRQPSGEIRVPQADPNGEAAAEAEAAKKRASSASIPRPPSGAMPRPSSGAVPRPPSEALPKPSGETPRPPSEEDLHEFFEQTSAQQSDEQHTVVIGDDFELLREGGDVNEVISDFRDATMEILDLDDFQAHYDLGTTYMEMELFDEAAAEFEISARGEDFVLASQEMLGYCFLRKGQIDVAIKELHKGLAIEGYEERDKLGLLYNLGIACGVLDQEQKAIDHFQKILEIDPDFRDTRSRLERLVQNSA